MKFQDDISNERSDTRASRNQYTLPTFSKLGAYSENIYCYAIMVAMGKLQQSFRPGNESSQEHIVW